jgi:hypothetical protein
MTKTDHHPVFMIFNRHNEILTQDGEFYPLSTAFMRRVIRFETQAEAEAHARTIRDYTLVADHLPARKEPE